MRLNSPLHAASTEDVMLHHFPPSFASHYDVLFSQEQEKSVEHCLMVVVLRETVHQSKAISFSSAANQQPPRRE